MKNIIYTILALGLIACNNDDDTIIENNEDELQFIFDVNKNFFLGEKWHLYEINSREEYDLNNDGIFNSNLLLEIPECEKDNFLIFDKFQEDVAIFSDSELECDDFDSKYSSGVIRYQLESDLNDMNSLQFQSILLGNLFDGSGSYLNLKGSISTDSSFKVINGIAIAQIDGESVTVEYKMIANSNDRPIDEE